MNKRYADKWPSSSESFDEAGESDVEGRIKSDSRNRRKELLSPLAVKPPKVAAIGELSALSERGSFWMVAFFSDPASLKERVDRLAQYEELASEAKAIMVLAKMRGAVGVDYINDWELRARLAEIELVAMQLDLDDSKDRALKTNGASGGRARAERLPSAKVKLEVYRLWLDWKVRRVATYKSDAEFHRQMQRKFLDESGNYIVNETDTIKRWCAKWKRDHKVK